MVREAIGGKSVQAQTGLMFAAGSAKAPGHGMQKGDEKMAENDQGKSGVAAEVHENPSGFGGLFSPKGRIGRLTYFFIVLANMVISAVLGVISEAVGDAGAVLVVIVIIPVIWVGIMAIIKRCHDNGWSGWLALLAPIPIVNIIFGLIMLFKKGEPGSNRYGPDPLAA